MNVLFLGYAVSLADAEKLSGVSIAGNKMQVNVLNGLAEKDDVHLDSITVYPVAPFPKEKRIWINGEELRITHNAKSYRVPFLNIPVIKQLWQMLSVLHCAKKRVDKDTILFTFNMFPQVGIPAVWLKKKYRCKIVCLLADLPIDDNTTSKSCIRRLLRKSFDNKTKKALKHCDGFVALNKNAVDIYAPGTKYIVMEGGVDPRIVNRPSFEIKNNKRIVYCGALTEYSGVVNLISAMDLVTDKEIILEIYGSGYLADMIQRVSNQKQNIKYMGRVTNERMMEIQREAALLVNPRPTDNPISQVTFPSKLFEYMLSGTPVLTTKLCGLSEEFLNHLMYVNDETPQGFADAISHFFNSDDIFKIDMARGAFDFIVDEKNWDIQNNRIFHFLAERIENE